MNTGMHTSLKISVLQGARGWCTGMTQGDGMGREVGGGFRMGNTCTLMADSSQCMAKPIQYCKVKNNNNNNKKEVNRKKINNSKNNNVLIFLRSISRIYC